MAYETLIVAYESGDQASSAIREIRRLGVPQADIRRHPISSTTVEEVAEAPVAEGSSGFWGWLFGEDTIERRLAIYRKALQNGGTVLTVRVLEEVVPTVRKALRRFDPLDLEEGTF